MWKVYFSDFTGGIHTDLRILPVDFTGGILCEAFVDLRWIPDSGIPIPDSARLHASLPPLTAFS